MWMQSTMAWSCGSEGGQEGVDDVGDVLEQLLDEFCKSGVSWRAAAARR